MTEEFIYNRDVDWLRESDCVIAEVTQPSLGVGYELGFAESLKIPVLCLYVAVVVVVAYPTPAAGVFCLFVPCSTAACERDLQAPPSATLVDLLMLHPPPPPISILYHHHHPTLRLGLSQVSINVRTIPVCHDPRR